MTQNDIAYYNARKEAKDARLRRRETKRHNEASEAADKLKAAASYLSAQAAQTSAGAAALNAATNRATYNLEYATQYGVGPDDQQIGTGYLDLATGETFLLNTDPSYDRLRGYRMWKEGREDVISFPVTEKGTPNKYIEGLIVIEEGKANVALKESQKTKNFWETLTNTAKGLAGTVNIIVDTGSNVLFGSEERHKPTYKRSIYED